MTEPKYKLNKKDAARWHELLTRHCCEVGPTKQKFPPLTPKENVEFERLDRKRHRKICAHPAVKASLEIGRRQMRKTNRLMKKVESLKSKYETKPKS
jgi:hypothetical protein